MIRFFFQMSGLVVEPGAISEEKFLESLTHPARVDKRFVCREHREFDPVNSIENARGCKFELGPYYTNKMYDIRLVTNECFFLKI